jgi:hypothetical protein
MGYFTVFIETCVHLALKLKKHRVVLPVTACFYPKENSTLGSSVLAVLLSPLILLNRA